MKNEISDSPLFNFGKQNQKTINNSLSSRELLSVGWNGFDV